MCDLRFVPPEVMLQDFERFSRVGPKLAGEILFGCKGHSQSRRAVVKGAWDCERRHQRQDVSHVSHDTIEY